jgi:hypothetical protein
MKKMEKIVQELDRERRRLKLSIFQLIPFFPSAMSNREFYRWIREGTSPTPVYRTFIRQAIREMKKLPTPKADPLTEFRDLYRTIASKLSVEEKVSLLDLSGEEYEKRLQELALKYRGQTHRFRKDSSKRRSEFRKRIASSSPRR